MNTCGEALAQRIADDDDDDDDDYDDDVARDYSNSTQCDKGLYGLQRLGRF